MWMKDRTMILKHGQGPRFRKVLLLQFALIELSVSLFHEANAAVPLALRSRHELKQDLQSMIEDMSQERYLTQLAPIYSSKKSKKTEEFGDLLRGRMGAFQEMKNLHREASSDALKKEESLAQKKVILRTANGQNCPERSSSPWGLKIERVCLDQFDFVGASSEVVRVKDRILGLTQHQREKKAARAEFESYVESQTQIVSDLEKQSAGLRLKDSELSQKIDQMNDSEMNDILKLLVWEYEHVKGLVRPELIARYGSLAAENVASCHSYSGEGDVSSTVSELFGGAAPIAARATGARGSHAGESFHGETRARRLGSVSSELDQSIEKLCQDRALGVPNSRELYLFCLEEALFYQRQRQGSGALAHHQPPPVPPFLGPHPGLEVQGGAQDFDGFEGFEGSESSRDDVFSAGEEALDWTHFPTGSSWSHFKPIESSADPLSFMSGRRDLSRSSPPLDFGSPLSRRPPTPFFFHPPSFGDWPSHESQQPFSQSLLQGGAEERTPTDGLALGGLRRRGAGDPSSQKKEPKYTLLSESSDSVLIRREDEPAGKTYLLVPDQGWNKDPERVYPAFIQEKGFGFYCDPQNSNECYRVELRDGFRKTTKYILPSSPRVLLRK